MDVGQRLALLSNGTDFAMFLSKGLRTLHVKRVATKA
jgi:hypothetical protein